MPSTPKENLKVLLRELFQLDNTDLDFGIYRILNIKSKEVEKFINEELDNKIEEVKSKILARSSTDLRAELDAAKKELTEKFQVNFQHQGDIEAKAQQYKQLALFAEPYKKFLTAQDKLNALRVSEETEKDIYNRLYDFFQRYYEGGDFVSKPRSGANNYMIPYNGEEVKLYWANYDQYYIKTGENFKNYLFNNGSTNPATRTNIEFKILDADTAQNNNKEEKGRLFIPDENYFEWIAEERKLQIKFQYKVPTPEQKQKWGEKQSVKKESKGINQKLIADLEKKIKSLKDAELLLLWQKTRPNSKGDAIPLFQFHLERYTTVNNFDFFIHKNLKGFLSRELDYFLKNEVLSINFLNPDWKETEVQESIKLNVLKSSAIRDIALTVIEFMGELENFQKRLFEKKKFVVQSDYCLSLDCINDKSLLHEVLDHILNDKDEKQIKDWLWLGFITDRKEIKKIKDILPSAESPLRFLVMDTAFLNESLKWKLLSSFENLNDLTNGILINSDNWQALNFIYNTYSKKIDCVHIDPPYNTDTSGFLYKNSFRRSSWLSMMDSRLIKSFSFLNQSASYLCHIDENEYEHLQQLFAQKNFPYLSTIIWDKRNPMMGGTGIAVQHEFIIWASNYLGQFESKSENVKVMLAKAKELIKEYKGVNTKSREAFAEWIKEQKNLSGGEKMYQFLEDDGRVYRLVAMTWPNPNPAPEQFWIPLIHPITGKPCPVPNRGWSRTPIKMKELLDKDEIVFGVDERTQPQRKIFLQMDSRKPISTVISSGKKGKAEVEQLGLQFSYCHPVGLYEELLFASIQNENGIVLDYFAGSGTNGHAVINLNRSHNMNHKYILVEMGTYFSSVTKPRIQKVIFSDTWKDGKPAANGKGVSQIFQYIKLEQYEDSLNNIEFNDTAIEKSKLSFFDKLFYSLDYGAESSDSLLNIEKFFNPFTYKMKIVKLNEVEPAHEIDLLTTFNFFIGIDVQRYVIDQQQDKEYRIVLGKKGQQKYIIVWRHFEDGKLNLTKERDWIKKQKWFSADAILYCNGDNGFGANSTEAEFKRLMNEPVN